MNDNQLACEYAGQIIAMILLANLSILSFAFWYFNKFKKQYYNAGANRAFNEMKKYADKIQYRKLAQLYRERKNEILKNL